ncbi:MAG: hypothetical protein GY874_23715 [Desulfobacteraceae bacterium]|nr:hypothetical protein [Desulfobacteraceae bacterium]
MGPIVALWTHPRSISTAFERVMMERGDFNVLHEPFSYYYYVHNDTATIEQQFIDPDHPTAYPDIKKHVIDSAETSPVFFKDMCSHCFKPVVQDSDFLGRLVNTFLIRDPAKAIPSYYAMNKDVTSREIGLEQLYNVFEKVSQINGTPPVVVDATDLENDPGAIMNSYCNAVKIPFIQEAMTWDQSHKKEWDIWKDWHKDAAKSSGIQKNMEVFEVTIENSDHLKRLYDTHYPFYERLYRHRISPLKS